MSLFGEITDSKIKRQVTLIGPSCGCWVKVIKIVNLAKVAGLANKWEEIEG